MSSVLDDPELERLGIEWDTAMSERATACGPYRRCDYCTRIEPKLLCGRCETARVEYVRRFNLLVGG